MADGPSAEDAATDLGDGDSRVTRERHKRQDVPSSPTTTTTSLSTGQDAARRVHEDAPTAENHPHDHPHRNGHAHRHPHRCHRHYRHHNHEERVGKDGGAGGDASCAVGPTSDYDEYDEEESSAEVVPCDYRAGGVRVEVVETAEGDGGNGSNSGADGAAMTGNAPRCDDAVVPADGRRSRLVNVDKNERAAEVNDREDREGMQKPSAVARKSCEEKDDAVPKTSDGAAAAAASAASSSAVGVPANGLVAARHQGSPFKGQVRMAEDTLVGPCGKKRCADRYDSSESSDR
ncbi:hypothetical protein KM043_005668 [Ampulex compressa]|nr:hypothetical protein KM043_005668 [Ampulex compressa]